jgi:hypothetical protein
MVQRLKASQTAQPPKAVWRRVFIAVVKVSVELKVTDRFSC